MGRGKKRKEAHSGATMALLLLPECMEWAKKI